jgi:hypothetical protein
MIDIESHLGENIRKHSFDWRRKEQSSLGTQQVKVRDNCHTGNELDIIQMKQIERVYSCLTSASIYYD